MLTLFTPSTAMPIPPAVGGPPWQTASLAAARLPNASQLAGFVPVLRKKMPMQLPRTELLAMLPGPLASRTKMPALALFIPSLFVTVGSKQTFDCLLGGDDGGTMMVAPWPSPMRLMDLVTSTLWAKVPAATCTVSPGCARLTAFWIE